MEELDFGGILLELISKNKFELVEINGISMYLLIPFFKKTLLILEKIQKNENCFRNPKRH